MFFTNIPEDAMIQAFIEDGFKLVDGHPTFAKKMSDPVNAKKMVQEMIKHTYQNGWNLPSMP